MKEFALFKANSFLIAKNIFIWFNLNIINLGDICMQINQNTQTSFCGKFSPKALAKFKENLSPGEYKTVKNFRAGKKYTQFDIVTISSEPIRLMNGTQITTNSTYAEFSNSRSKSRIKGRIKLAEGILPFDMNTFSMFNEKLVKLGENLLEKYK